MLYPRLKEQQLLQDKGALSNELNIKDTVLFKNSDIVRFLVGLGAFKDLTQTPSMKKCRSCQLESKKGKEKNNE